MKERKRVPFLLKRHVHVVDFVHCWLQAMRSCDKAPNPVYVSPGHLITMETAVWLVKLCCKYRIPEPIRQVTRTSYNSQSETCSF